MKMITTKNLAYHVLIIKIQDKWWIHDQDNLKESMNTVFYLESL